MRILSVTGVVVSVALLTASAAFAQQDSHAVSVGDVARTQRELRKQRLKKKPPAAVHSNDEIVPTDVAEKGESLLSSPADPAAKPRPPVDAEKTPPIEQPHLRSVLDHPGDTVPDKIVVPAGTELRVDIHEHKVVIPVRVGFATPIPALSQVTVKLDRTYVGTTYSPTGTPYVDYIEYATVTAVTVAGTTYEVQTDSVPLLKGGTNNELTFVLGGPVAVLR